MKKITVIALVLVLAFGAAALAACGGTQTVTGEYYYENEWVAGTYYGAKVDVTVSGNTITKVKLYTDEETGWTRTTTTWEAADGQLGYAAAEAAYDEWIQSVFVGKTVEEVNAYTADTTPSVSPDSAKLSGATLSSARIILAVQNALSKLED